MEVCLIEFGEIKQVDLNQVSSLINEFQDTIHFKVEEPLRNIGVPDKAHGVYSDQYLYRLLTQQRPPTNDVI